MALTKYLISFNDGAMDFSEEELAIVTQAGLAVAREATEAGVWVFSGGLTDHRGASVVAVDGTVGVGHPDDAGEHLGGFAVIDVASRDEALRWAAKIAAACHCAQEVRAFVPDPPR